MNGFLPISKQDMTDRGWYYCDFLIVTGDAYVDHPSFGTAIISRVLEDAGYKVAILSQPDFRDEHDFLEMGIHVPILNGEITTLVNHWQWSLCIRLVIYKTAGRIKFPRPAIKADS